MSKSRIIVIGSSNIDMVIRTDCFPKPGETILGGDFFMNQGGKGANQAVAAARLGGDVLFVSSVGNDIFGKMTLQSLQQEGVDVEYIRIDSGSPSGIAIITVDRNGENNIVVAPGANSTLSPTDIQRVEHLIEEGSFMLMQLEIPIQTVEYVVSKTINRGAKVILNPAPAQDLSQLLLSQIYLLTPNEEEASLLSGISVHDVSSAREAARNLTERGVQNVIITMGAKGALALYEGEYIYMEAQKVTALDTTAAGDVFNGALFVALNGGKSIREALKFAGQASAIAVTRLGAQSSSPYLDEIENRY
ncbi:ribokinase [Sphingobacterium chuzhouense]|uniref:Ribokinase n=1 Tax=Sphingobacterium chuzhouense TaxID=1742264 RepID=A0ABR7XVL4_9SPHI|nr:ribokinase [Sphingobacterium chuzhouense]MBD1423081.1 ribokinase [Sphingobacterium chuzhouense]